MRNKTKNIKKCKNQMCLGKPKSQHLNIKSNFDMKRGRVVQGKKEKGSFFTYFDIIKNIFAKA